MNETNYTQFYLIIIEKLSKHKNWCVTFKDTYSVNLKEAFILKLQETFENKIESCDKSFGLKIMSLLASLYTLKWMENTVFEDIIEYLLSKNDDIIFLEYVICFIKEANHANFEEIKNRILSELKITTRLRFMLEEKCI